jgi:hypothetical protein
MRADVLCVLYTRIHTYTHATHTYTHECMCEAECISSMGYRALICIQVQKRQQRHTFNSLKRIIHTYTHTYIHTPGGEVSEMADRRVSVKNVGESSSKTAAYPSLVTTLESTENIVCNVMHAYHSRWLKSSQDVNSHRLVVAGALLFGPRR